MIEEKNEKISEKPEFNEKKTAPEDKARKGQDAPVKRKSKKKKILLGCLTVVLVFILVLVGTILYVMASVFDEKPAPSVVKIPDVKALESATQKLLKTLGVERVMSGNTNIEDLDLNSLGLGDLDLGNIDLNNVEDLDFGELIKKIDVGKALGVLSKPGSLTLSKGEVNALIATAFSADKVGNFQESRETKVYDAWFDNGRFTIKLTLDSKIPTPFGSYCDIQIVFVPQVIDHHLKLDLYSAKIGTISCPVSYFKDLIDTQLLIYEQSDEGKQILEMIDSLEIDEDKVVLEYNFQSLSMFILDKQDTIELFNNSSDVSPEEILKLFK